MHIYILLLCLFTPTTAATRLHMHIYKTFRDLNILIWCNSTESIIYSNLRKDLGIIRVILKNIL